MHNDMFPLLRPDGASCHTHLGYVLKGAHSGPCLMVGLHQPALDVVAEAVKRTPRLNRMQGSLVLVCLDLLGTDGRQDAWLLTQTGIVDATLFIPMQMPRQQSGTSRTSPAREAVDLLLAKAEALVMLATQAAKPAQQNSLRISQSTPVISP